MNTAPQFCIADCRTLTSDTLCAHCARSVVRAGEHTPDCDCRDCKRFHATRAAIADTGLSPFDLAAVRVARRALTPRA